MKTLLKSKLFVAAAFTIVAGTAQAGFLDANVMINRAANNKTLSVRYEGAAAKLVELRINGKSAATRSVSEKQTSGETSFTINVANLESGENQVEVVLYDADGKVVGTQKTVINVDRTGTGGPIYLKKPQQGATVRGPMEISLGLREDLRNIFVSFFVDDQLVTMKNFPPYSYLWDTTKVENGWHEVQAWVVDKENNTFKTEKMRVFVNNIGGRTERENSGSAAVGNDVQGAVTDPGTSIRPVSGKGGQMVETIGGTVEPSVAVQTQASIVPKGPIAAFNTIAPALGSLATTKPVGTAAGQATGPQLLRPRIEVNSKATGSHMAPIANTTTSIAYGTRLPAKGTFSLLLDGAPINFDVEPRVENGIPLSPFRHLFEHQGGSVKWMNDSKEVQAVGMGRSVWFQVGNEMAKVDDLQLRLELAPFIDRGRVLVPLSFLVDSLDFKIDYDSNTGHVFVTSNSKK